MAKAKKTYFVYAFEGSYAHQIAKDVPSKQFARSIGIAYLMGKYGMCEENETYMDNGGQLTHPRSPNAAKTGSAPVDVLYTTRENKRD